MARPLTYREFQFDARDDYQACSSMVITIAGSDPRYRYVDEPDPGVITTNIPLYLLRRYQAVGGYRLPEPLTVPDDWLPELGLA